jgi:hypothetical protein
MADKILYAFINYFEDRADNVKKAIQKVANNKEDILVITKCLDTFGTWKALNIDNNVAISRNFVLKYAKEHGYNYCFIIDDDVKILDKFIFKLYVNLMNKYKLPFVMYGFHNQNRVLGFRPNPAIIAKVSAGETACFSRFACNGVIGFKINEDLELFNEKLQILELQEYCNRHVKNKKIPFFGFFFDINESWKYFERHHCSTSRSKTQPQIESDIKEIGGAFNLDNNADELINLLRKVNGLI